MYITRMDDNGNIIVPSEVITALGVKEKDSIVIKSVNNGEFAVGRIADSLSNEALSEEGFKLCKTTETLERFEFYTYLFEQYSRYRGTVVSEILEQLEEKHLSEVVYSMYEMYRSKANKSFFKDLDSILETGKSVW